MTVKFATKRGGWWIYRRRVPEQYAAVDRRAFVKITTKIRVADDPYCRLAGPVIEKLNAQTEHHWLALLGGLKAETENERYEAAVKRVRQEGMAYVPARRLAMDDMDAGGVPLADLLARVEAIGRGDGDVVPGRKLERDVEALLGGVEVPSVLLSGLFDEFEGHEKLHQKGMAEDQVRKWRNPKIRAVNNLLDVIGDKPVFEITRGDALQFRTWWQNRILEDNLNPDTANKDFGHLNVMLKTLATQMQLDVVSPFRELRFKAGKPTIRQAFDPAFVRDVIFAPGALDGLNREARAIICVVSETGARLSEACNGIFVLDGPIPYLDIQAKDRRTKTWQSIRQIPLVGVAHQAALAFPNGFERYKNKADQLSALVNKYMLAHGMRPTMDHTLYSLRHTFEDRMTAVEVTDRIAADLMGHKLIRPKYGAGSGLAQKQEWLKKIVYPVTMDFS